MSLSVVVLRSLAECERHAAAIDALNAASWRPCPFSTFAHMRAHVTHDEFGALTGDEQLTMLLCFEGKELLGYLPLRKGTLETFGLQATKLQLLMTHDVDRPHVVARPEDLERVKQAFLRCLTEDERGWDVLELWDQDDTGDLLSTALPPSASPYHARRIPLDPVTSIELRWPGLEQYYRALSRKFRNNVARNARRLFVEGALEWIWAEEPASAAALFPSYVELETRSWKQAIDGTIARHPRRVAYFKALFGAEHAMRLKLGLLSLDGLPVGGILCGAFGSTLYLLQIAFDEAYAEGGPGLLTFFMSVRQGILGGYRTLNLLHGSMHYKDRWLAQSTPTYLSQLLRRGSAPYAKARLGDLRRTVERLVGDGGAGRFNPSKRQLEDGAVVARLADRETPRRMLQQALAPLGVERLRTKELASALPFAVERVAEAPIGRMRQPVRQARRTSRPAVAVFDPDSPPSLAITRSLGRAGVDVHVYGPSAWSVARTSRYAKRYLPCPDPEDMSAFLPWLERRMKSGEIELVLPTSDLVAFHLAELRELLPPPAQAMLPDREAMLGALFKDRFAVRCGAAGQPVPQSFHPTSRDEAAALAKELPYPVILKPRSHVGVGLERGVIVHNPDELSARFIPYLIGKKAATLVARYPELRWPLIQAYVPGALDNLFSVSGLLAGDGRVVAAAVSKKQGQWPPTLGIGTLFDGCEHAPCLATGVAAVQKLLGRGLFELELIWDAQQACFVAIDLNPRGYGQIALDIARGNDLPRLWYELATGETVAAREPPRPARWVHSIPYHLGAWVRLLQGPERAARLRSYLGGLAGASVDVVHERQDPLPTLLFAAKMLRHPGGLIRPFINDGRGVA